jgi:hypothetical protein
MSYRANMEYEDLQVKLQQWVVKNKARLNDTDYARSAFRRRR